MRGKVRNRLWGGDYLFVLLALQLGCQDPPAKRVDRVPGPELEHQKQDAEQFKREAHEEALTAALPLVRAALVAGDPLAAYQAGHGPAEIPPLSLSQQVAIAKALEPAQLAVDDIDESMLTPAGVVILRTVRFGLTRIHDDLERRPPLRQDPVVALRSIERVLDELHYRLLVDDCDANCEALPTKLAAALPEAREQLAAASLAATLRAQTINAAIVQRSRALAERPLLGDRSELTAGLEQLATAVEGHGRWLAALSEALPNAKSTHVWTAKPAPLGRGKQAGQVATIERLPDIVGAHALTRRLSVEQRIDLEPGPAFAQIEDHVRRWDALRRELVGGEVGHDASDASVASPVDLDRCEAALGRIRAGLEGLPNVEAPTLDCARYLGLLGDRERSEGALVLELLDLGVIEPQRRALRASELPELALVTGRGSPEVHVHLRRVMLLAQIGEPAARSLAIDAGQQALCLAEAALWIHAELGPASEVALTVGPPCAAIGDAATITARTLGDPRGTLAGFGLSLIGDEPARMVGFDRFYWAPLGLMQILATPKGMHPDQFTLADPPSAERPANPSAPVKVEIEKL